MIAAGRTPSASRRACPRLRQQSHCDHQQGDGQVHPGQHAELPGRNAADRQKQRDRQRQRHHHRLVVAIGEQTDGEVVVGGNVQVQLPGRQLNEP